jgi:hypothetical protein
VLAVGGWLLVVGVCDLLRAARDTTSWSRRLLIVGLGVVLLVMFGLVVGLSAKGWATLGVVMVLSLVVWVLASSAALDAGVRVSKPALTLAFGAFAVGLAGTIVGGGAADFLPALPAAFEGSLVARVPSDRLVFGLGVAVAQLATANVLVRLLLDAVGVPATTNEKKLKGGRLLGPMERLFILGLGLAGQLTAASVVVAAKGLLRFPELQRASAGEPGPDGPSDVTEYFLIGTFASWLLALGGLALLLM